MKTARFIAGIAVATLLFYALGLARPAAFFAVDRHSDETVIAGAGTDTLDLPQFDPALGTLTSVQIEAWCRFTPPSWYTGAKEWGAAFSMKDTTTASPNPAWGWFGVNPADLPDPSEEGEEAGVWEKVRWKAFGSTQVAPRVECGTVYVLDSYDYFGPQMPTVEIHAEEEIGYYTNTLTTGLSGWIGTGDITWTAEGEYGNNDSSSSGGSPQHGWDAWTEIAVTYTYTPF